MYAILKQTSYYLSYFSELPGYFKFYIQVNLGKASYFKNSQKKFKSSTHSDFTVVVSFNNIFSHTFTSVNT